MNSSYGLVLLACVMFFATCVHSSEVQARQRGYFFAPFFAPWAWPVLQTGLAPTLLRPQAKEKGRSLRSGDAIAQEATDGTTYPAHGPATRSVHRL